MKIYTVYIDKNVEKPNETVEFIPEGFLWWSLIPGINLFWAMQRKCWLYLLLIFLTHYIFEVFAQDSPLFSVDLFVSGLGYKFYMALRLILIVFLGVNGYDFWRKKLVSKGYEMIGVVAANSEIEAQRRFFEKSGI